MITIRPAREGDLDGFLSLASQVEHWFGPMVEEPGFHRAVNAHIRDGAALVAETTEPAAAPGPVGGLLFGTAPPTYHVHWLVTAAHCRGAGVGPAPSGWSPSGPTTPGRWRAGPGSSTRGSASAPASRPTRARRAAPARSTGWTCLVPYAPV